MAGTDFAEHMPNSVTTAEIYVSLVVSNNSLNSSSVFRSGSISLYVSESIDTRSVKLIVSHSEVTRMPKSNAAVATSHVPARAYMAPLLNMASAATKTVVDSWRLVRRAPKSGE